MLQEYILQVQSNLVIKNSVINEPIGNNKHIL